MATVLDRQVPTSEVTENCVNYSVMFPRGNNHARGKFIRGKRDTIGNDIGSRNYTYLTRANIVLILMMEKSSN